MHRVRNHHLRHHHSRSLDQSPNKTYDGFLLPKDEEEDLRDLHDAELFKAYFTPMPPPEPQILVLVGDIPNHLQMQEKLHRLIRNITAIDDFIGLEEKQSPDTRPVVETKESRRNRVKKRRTRKVRQLLNQLITNLPLFDDLDSSSSTAVGEYYRSRALQSSPTKQLSCCSIAVQARDGGSPLNSSSNDWLGGVRALRDSHVRLVQRQLRHIKRLNRALDRVTRTDITNPVKQVRV